MVKYYNFDKKYQIQDFSHVDIHKFKPTNWTTDMGSFYADSLEPNINNWISDYEQKTSIEIGIITVKSLKDKDGYPEEIEDYAGEEFERLGVGKKGANNGILIVLSMDDRKSRIQTGRGIEEFLTDVQCQEILDNVVKPYFKEGKYYEGTMAALQSIRQQMGEEPFAKKMEWLKQKEAKQKLENEKANQEVIDTLFDIFLWGLLITSIIGPIVYLYRKRKKNKEFKLEVDKIMKTIEELKKSIPNTTGLSSDKLNGVLKSLKSLSEGHSDIPLVKGQREDYLTDLVKFGGELDEAIKEYQFQKSTILKYVSDIQSWNSLTNNALLSLDAAISAYKEVKNLGYNSTQPADKSEINKLSKLGEDAKSLLQTNIDDAISNYKSFKSKIESIVSTGQSSTSTLSSIKYATSNTQNAKSKIDSALDDMNRYKSWAKSGEKDEIDSVVASFYKNTEKDVLKLNKILESVISKINDMRSKWKKRKDDEEYEEKRKKDDERRRREDDERRSSYSSSSSSSSSFGGFGGGSSGGGGATSGW